MKFNYTPSGICASNIEIEVEDGIIKNIDYTGGCDGNLTGIAKLAQGMNVSEIIEKFDGIKCGNKSTSCPGQLAEALKSIPL